MDSAANSAVIDVVGGMVLKGAGAGDYYATMNTEAAGASPLDIVMVKRGPTVQLRLNGATHTMSLPARPKPAAAAGFDLNAITPYVKDVSVSTVDVNGRTEDKVTGTIDGNELLQNLPGSPPGWCRRSAARSATSRCRCSFRGTRTWSRRRSST